MRQLALRPHTRQWESINGMNFLPSLWDSENEVHGMDEYCKACAVRYLRVCFVLCVYGEIIQLEAGAQLLECNVSF